MCVIIRILETVNIFKEKGADQEKKIMYKSQKEKQNQSFFKRCINWSGGTFFLS